MKNKPKDEQAQLYEQAKARTSSGTNCFRDEHSQLKKIVCIIALAQCYSDYRYFQLKKEYSYDQCPYSVYFNILLLIIVLCAIETLICHTEIEVNRVYILRYCKKYLT